MKKLKFQQKFLIFTCDVLIPGQNEHTLITPMSPFRSVFCAVISICPLTLPSQSQHSNFLLDTKSMVPQVLCILKTREKQSFCTFTISEPEKQA